MLPLPLIRFNRRASKPQVKPQDPAPLTPEQRRELDALHEDYIERVNEAIEQDREDLAWAHADAYSAEVLRITADERSGD